MDCSAFPPSIVELSILLTDDFEIQSLNRDFRGKDKPTDVLSFSMLEGEDLLPGEVSLGDIAISLETCLKQAKEQNVSCGEELLRLLIHGCLHLFGFEHEDVSEETAQEMFDLQERLIEELADCAPSLFEPPTEVEQ